ncbi:MAG: hypothetical protein LBL18_00460 [Bacteroidales bacterium]|jgi:hypothetical protein|nr:hypothetical protein [Bacteroidales bacterium]
MEHTVTFWKSDFAGENLGQLIGILEQDAIKGVGRWFMNKTNFIVANMLTSEYEWIMNNVANYGDLTINK